MSIVILTSEEDFRRMMREEIQAALSDIDRKKAPKKDIPINLTLNQVIEYMMSKGVKISKSHLYAKTSKNEIPHSKANNKYLIFNRNEIDQWIDNQMIHRKQNTASTMLRDYVKNNRRDE